MSKVENISGLSCLQILLRHNGLFQPNNQDFKGIQFSWDSSLVKYLHYPVLCTEDDISSKMWSIKLFSS